MRFDPPIDDANKSKIDWGAFEVPRDDVKPITVEQLTEQEELRTLIGEIREKVEREGESDVTVSLLQLFDEVHSGW